MPPVLMELMRHDSIETTLKFYVGQNALRTTNVVWEAYEKAQEAAEKTLPKERRDTLRDTEPNSQQKGG
jgi:hypothetical protein